jgi:hypothetical protein
MSAEGWHALVVEGCRRAVRQFEEYSRRPDADPRTAEALKRRAEWCRQYALR